MNNVEYIKEQGFTVIFRGIPFEKVAKTVTALYEGGVRIIEIAFSPDDSDTIEKTTAMLREARRVAPDDMLIGAGTVISEDFVTAAYEAGAQFIYTPDTDADVIKLTKKLGLVSIPGALTPTECKTAYKLGADIIKLFPSTIDTIDYIINIMRPLSHIPFICVGGTNENTIEAFFRAGALGVGTGLSVLKPELIESENYKEISRLATLHVEKVREAKQKYGK